MKSDLFISCGSCSHQSYIISRRSSPIQPGHIHDYLKCIKSHFKCTFFFLLTLSDSKMWFYEIEPKPQTFRCQMRCDSVLVFYQPTIMGHLRAPQSVWWRERMWNAIECNNSFTVLWNETDTQVGRCLKATKSSQSGLKLQLKWI